MIQLTKDLYGQMVDGRSSKWPAVRKEFLKWNPVCAACGQADALNVHHIEPFHVRPDLELDPQNLLTLCEAGPARCNCHLLIGHSGNWKAWNPKVRQSAAYFRAMLARRKVAS